MRRAREKLGLRGELILAFFPTLTVLGVLVAVEVLTEQRLLFASLASSAFLIYLDPEHGTNEVRTLLIAHVAAALLGWGTFSLFGSGYFSAAAAMVSTILLMIVLDAVHPPAVATAMGFALRAGDASNLVLFGLALGIMVILVILQRVAVRVIAWERMHLVFNFILNNHFFLALVRQESEPLERALATLPSCPTNSQWANFVRNHDELNLDRLSPEERHEVFDRFAHDPAMRIYRRGIRRRLPPMVRGNRHQLEMIYSLLFSFPGAPVIRYGQEIGMGDDLGLPGRMSVRTPMQWSSGANAGFSAADSEKLIRPVVSDDCYGYRTINVDRQRRDPESLLNFFLRLIRTRKECPEIGRGTFRLLDTGDRRVFGIANEWKGGTALVFNNLSAEECEVRYDVDPEWVPHLTDLLTDREYPAIEEAEGTFTIGPFGYRWRRVSPFGSALGLINGSEG